MTSIVFDYAAINKGMRDKGMLHDHKVTTAPIEEPQGDQGVNRYSGLGCLPEAFSLKDIELCIKGLKGYWFPTPAQWQAAVTSCFTWRSAPQGVIFWMEIAHSISTVKDPDHALEYLERLVELHAQGVTP